MSTLAGTHPGYRRAFLDWLACAWAGRGERASLAATGPGVDPTLALAAAGHVLDFDDTYAPGLSHLSAPTAPAALTMGVAVGATIGNVLDGYAAGFEAMAALSRASHPALYEAGWHPTAVTGTVGAAVAAGRVAGLDDAALGNARRLALLGAGGMRAAFGSDGKSLQVGMAAAQGVAAVRLAMAGAVAGGRIESAYESTYGGSWAEPGPVPAIDDNWIKAFPCCLQTHSGIEAAAIARRRGAGPGGGGVVIVHPRSRQAAPFDDVRTGLEAKFSIPYTVAITVLRGPPSLSDFSDVDDDVRALASRVVVEIDDSLAESTAILRWSGDHDTIEVEVEAARGSPQRPMTDGELRAKVQELAGTRFDGMLDDPQTPASLVLEAVLPG